MMFDTLKPTWICLIVSIGLACGCAKLQFKYGESDGATARQSPASVSIFRRLVEENNKSTISIQAFSPRVMTKIGAIVWVPDKFETHLPETFTWLDQWLSQGGKTLVYVGRDFSPMAELWEQVSTQFVKNESQTDDRPSLLEAQALEESRLDFYRGEMRRKVAIPWCMFDHSPSKLERINHVEGPWSTDLDMNGTRLFVRSFPLPYVGSSISSLESSFDRESDDTSNKPQNSDLPGFKWQKHDIEMLSVIRNLDPSDLPKLTPLLTTGDGRALVSEITCKRWQDAKILLVTNASLVSNISLVNPGNLQIAKKLVECIPQQKLGFLSGTEDPPIRKSDHAEQQKGFEMLTIWPMNVITLHAVFLGLLVLLAVFPIFGRAKNLPRRSTQDFGQHIEAMGGLLHKSGDRFYALSTIAEYFRNVRKEPTSPWARAEPNETKEATSPFQSS